MKYYKISAIVLIVFVFTVGFKPVEVEHKEIFKTPKNVILLIGDGMGLSQVSSSFYFGNENSSFERFKQIGFIKTSSESHLITDSAAGATAFSAGIKTYNGAIGVDKDALAVPLITHKAAEAKVVSGLISTSSITHATPASFFAYVERRSMQEDIAAQLPASEIDFFVGAGNDFFFKRKDNKDLSATFSKNGFIIDTVSLKKPQNFNLDNKYGYLLAPKHMPKMTEGRGDFLSQATQLGIEYLSKNDHGFFLMVEGSQIDWGGHANDSEYIVEEVKDFSKVIGEVLDFAEKDGNTLVVVTADHETGGYTLASENGNYNKIKGSFSTGGHSATLIPVFAYGPGAENFQGIYENNLIYHKIMQLTNWGK
ncbi:alkaline phosphatase [Hwangdonia lutea]|uniref:Alkaline phosphatase n=1 Tax=Hwangdonia lutea TaxID=3075823 RepID=A0AA97ESH4_9FLAO|nr:alkaline phosphatase [Hwangdonia sp. SCSIO 19198]WOD45113.1 alkaline phosphatase [Hwangdonia sp. SCSIO 19198]